MKNITFRFKTDHTCHTLGTHDTPIFFTPSRCCPAGLKMEISTGYSGSRPINATEESGTPRPCALHLRNKWRYHHHHNHHRRHHHHHHPYHHHRRHRRHLSSVICHMSSIISHQSSLSVIVIGIIIMLLFSPVFLSIDCHCIVPIAITLIVVIIKLPSGKLT